MICLSKLFKKSINFWLFACINYNYSEGLLASRQTKYACLKINRGMEKNQCRVCLSVTKSISIDSKLGDRIVFELINEIAAVEVTYGDKLPKHVCLSCLAKIEQCFVFKKQIEASDRKLREELFCRKLIDQKETSVEIEEECYKLEDFNLEVIIDKEEDNSGGSIERENSLEHQEIEKSSSVTITKSIVQKPKVKRKKRDPAVCTICGGIYYDKYDLDLHEKRVHATERPFECDYSGCGKKFALEALLKRHAVYHTKRSFICNICGKAFIYASKLEKHQFVHSDLPKPLPCPHCTRTFTYKHVLDAHIISHSGKCFQCDECPKAYKWKEDLRNHKLVSHKGIYPYVCRYCGKGYSGSSNKNYHEKRCQEKPVEC